MHAGAVIHAGIAHGACMPRCVQRYWAATDRDRYTHPIKHTDEDTQTGIQRGGHLLEAREEEVISVHACEHVCRIST